MLHGFLFGIGFCLAVLLITHLALLWNLFAGLVRFLVLCLFYGAIACGLTFLVLLPIVFWPTWLPWWTLPFVYFVLPWFGIFAAGFYRRKQQLQKQQAIESFDEQFAQSEDKRQLTGRREPSG
jgi:hypothetical protein